MNTDGGPAFPRPPFTPGTRHDNAADAGFAATGHPGMSLRDWFAGQETLADLDSQEASVPRSAAEALAGRKPDLSHVTKADNWIEHLKWEAEWRAAIKYIRADAMLRARERGQESDGDEAWFAKQPDACVSVADDVVMASSGRHYLASGSTREAALRALRAKVEGGAR